MSAAESLQVRKTRSQGQNSELYALVADFLAIRDTQRAPDTPSVILSSIRDVSERSGVEQALQESERFARATFDALSDHICVLDETATIVSTNAAWDTFMAARGANPERWGKGANYLEMCAADGAAAAAGTFAEGLRAVIRGEQESCACEYSCYTPQEQRWFIARATRFLGDGPTRVVVAHEDITPLKLAEFALRATKDAAEDARGLAQAAERQSEVRRQEAERRRQVAENLHDVVAMLNSSRSLDEVLRVIVSQARRILGGQAAALYQRPGGTTCLELRAADGLPYSDAVAPQLGREGIPPPHAATPHPDAGRDTSSVPHRRERYHVPRRAGQPRTEGYVDASGVPVPKPFQSVLANPVVGNEGEYGSLAVYYLAPHRFTVEEEGLARLFCGQATLAVENARLRDKAKEAAVTAERGRLGRELHDGVTQAIFSASLIADSLPQVWEHSVEEGRCGLEELRQLTRGALAEMRTLLFESRPAALYEKRLGELLGQLATTLRSRTRIPVEVAVREEGVLPPEVHMALYRIVQEALNNVAKHAGATCASVRLRTANGSAAVRVRDDGRGFDVSALPGGQLGLGIMQERAKSIDARLRIVSRPGCGTVIAATWKGGARRR
jgi:signal transduction histidine kinase